MTLCFATTNPNKLFEIQKIVSSGVVITTPAQLGLHEEIKETGLTIRENAFIKARYIWEKLRIPCFADDTGLEVTALNGAPGVLSARYAGEQKSSHDNIDLLLRNLRGHSDRSAQFVTGICFIDESGVEHYFEGLIKGRIIESLRGDKGFGYDPVFVPEGYQATFAEMSVETKNKISHRARAIRLLVDHLNTSHK